MLFSLRHKIILTYSLLFVLVFLALGSWLAGFFARQFRENIEVDLVKSATLLSNLVLEQQDMAAFAATVSRELDVRVTIVDTAGFPLVETARPVDELENHRERPEINKALQGEIGIAERYSATVESELLYVATPVLGSEGEILYVLRLARSLDGILLAISQLKKSITYATLASVAVSWMLGMVLAKTITSSLETLTRKAREFGQGSFNTDKEIITNDEIGQMEQVFNEMGRNLLQTMAGLAHERTRVEQILHHLPVGVLVVDTQGKLVTANNSARKILQADAEGRGKPFTHLTRNWQVNAFVGDLLSQRKALQREIALSRDGTLNYLRLQGALFSTDGHENKGEAVVVLQDITDLRLLEQQRRDLVTNVSHELRTPLTAIQGFAETLLEEDVDLDSAKHFVNIIRQESMRLSQLINNLLNLSLLESGKKRKVGSSDLHSVAQEVVGLFKDLAKARGKDLVQQIGESISVALDRDYVKQILINYVDNAIKYTPEGTKIKIDAVIQDDGFARLVVVDNGPGIPAEAQRRLFERFFRVEGSRDRQAGGTGLGLAIVKHIVEGFGGQVGVISHPQSGTSFWATLPLNK